LFHSANFTRLQNTMYKPQAPVPPAQKTTQEKKNKRIKNGKS